MIELAMPVSAIGQAGDNSGSPRSWVVTLEPFKLLASVEPSLLSRWRPGVILVAEATVDELLNGQGPETREKALPLLESRLEQELVVGRISLGQGDEAEKQFAELQASPKDRGNQVPFQCLAWLLVRRNDSKVAVVCGNSRLHRRFAMTALAELGRGRVAHFFDLWIDLFERGWIDWEELGRLCESTRDGTDGLPRLPNRVAKLLRPD